jgi:hypothetical protein
VATLYDVLGVSPRATPDEVRRAYHDLVRTLHPDRHEGRSPDPQRLHDVNDAWRVLRDPATRASYDRSIEGQPRARRVPYRPQHAAPPGMPPDDDPDLDAPIHGRPVEPGDVGISVVRGLPWIAVALLLAVIFVFTAFAGGGEQSGARELIGRCVDRTTGRGVDAVPCEGPNDGEVVLVVDRATRCPADTTPAALSGEWLCVEPPDHSGR